MSNKWTKDNLSRELKRGDIVRFEPEDISWIIYNIKDGEIECEYDEFFDLNDIMEKELKFYRPSENFKEILPPQDEWVELFETIDVNGRLALCNENGKVWNFVNGCWFYSDNDVLEIRKKNRKSKPSAELNVNTGEVRWL